MDIDNSVCGAGLGRGGIQVEGSKKEGIGDIFNTLNNKDNLFKKMTFGRGDDN